VPFADVTRRVAVGFEDLSDRRFLQRQMLLPIRDFQFGERTLGAGDPIGDVQTRRIFAGHHRCPRRRTDGAGRVAVCQPHAAGGEAIDVGRFIELAAVARQIGPTHVIDENQNDVGRSVRRGQLSDE